MNLVPVSDITDQLPRHESREYSRRKKNPNLIVLHTTDTETTIERLARYDVSPGNHIDPKGMPALSYHAIIMKDGSVFKTLDYDEVAWHAGPHNGSSIGVAMMFKSQDKQGRDVYKPTRIQRDNTILFMASRCLDWGLTPDSVQGHRELVGTGFFWFKGSKRLRKSCPGMLTDMDAVREAVAVEMQVFLAERSFYAGEIDGSFGPASRAALAEYRKVINGNA